MDISGNRLSNLSILTCNPNIRILKANYCCIGRFIQEWETLIFNHCNIQTLEFNHNYFTPNSLSYCLKTIQNIPDLIELSLQFVFFEKKQYNIEALLSCCKIQKLDLSKNSFTKQDETELKLILKNESIRHLILKNVDGLCIESIQSMYPLLHISYD